MVSSNIGTYDNIIQSLLDIASGVEQQGNVARALPAEHNILVGQDGMIKYSIPALIGLLTKFSLLVPRRRLQLLLWHSKSELYAHAVELFAERQPLYRGTHIGTTLSTQIMAAVERRKQPIETTIKKYNEYRAKFQALLAPDEHQDLDPQDLTYRKFVNMSLDDAFWQDVYLYNSREPWACNSDVRAGIQAMLATQRADEEMSFIRNELSSALSWAVNIYNSITGKIREIDRLVTELSESDEDEIDDEMESRWGDLLPSISLGDCEDDVKAQLVLNVLNDQLVKHKDIMLGWAPDVRSLWNMLHGEIPQRHEWFELITTLASQDNATPPLTAQTDEQIGPNEEGDEVTASELFIGMMDLNEDLHVAN
ncbi:hypothetical protein PGTUg99_024225 [Puccinia graminis f. sp. tritici]|uniref:Uncharacterized protein n=1 Tax=Puccinia graminis f. sp. tritici TaxID=56615 RepID=A0A5B0S698_PUCGR|nr:hypothetical protein PGTUg99_024225 [Puccinia graminis f. sp. tritici]